MRVRIVEYDSPTTIRRIKDNKEKFVAEAKHYLDAVENELKRIDQAASAQYAGIVDISPDGAIQQVSWEIGPRGALTRASRNTEDVPFVPSYAERRRIERDKREKEKAAKTDELAKALSKKTTVIK